MTVGQILPVHCWQARMGIKVEVLDPTPSCPAASVAKQTLGSFRDPQKIRWAPSRQPEHPARPGWLHMAARIPVHPGGSCFPPLCHCLILHGAGTGASVDSQWSAALKCI